MNNINYKDSLHKSNEQKLSQNLQFWLKNDLKLHNGNNDFLVLSNHPAVHWGELAEGGPVAGMSPD